MEQNETSLIDRLTEYCDTAIPMHMPGHKRNTALLGNTLPYRIDITEIDGFDNLHDMHGILKNIAERAARLYGAKHSFPLVGGSTAGILATIHAMVPFGSHVLLARNCHKSVYNGVALRGLFPHYLLSAEDENGIAGKISPESVEKALSDNPEIKLVIITSPTYEGVVSNTREIGHICHNHGAILFVDAAHGAHFGFSPAFLPSACESGADVVVMSLHKTLPALTQTALLHICSDCINAEKLARCLAIYETSSPSYVLLSSIDVCLRTLEKDGEPLFSEYEKNLSFFYRQTEKCRHLSVIHYDDPGKIIISTKNTDLHGVHLAKLLRDTYHIETEMAGRDYVLAMTSISDAQENFVRLADALLFIDGNLCKKTDFFSVPGGHLPRMIRTPFDALSQDGEFVPPSSATGRESLAHVWAYPPGIPLIVPGEEISEQIVEIMESFFHADIDLFGLENGKMYVKK